MLEGCGRMIGPYRCCTVVCGDCLQLMRELPDGCVDAVITDPPYGLGEAAGKNLSRGLLADPTDYGYATWDDEPCPQLAIDEIRRVSITQVIFGGNFFHLPPTPCWLVWDKRNNGDFADCELAWTNLPKAIRIIHWLWNGMIRKNHEERFHPTQKPLGVMEWCIQQAGNLETILDPFLGSGTTAVAAKKLGRHFLGFEISPEYCRIAEERIALVEAQPTLFEKPAEQMTLNREEGT